MIEAFRIKLKRREGQSPEMEFGAGSNADVWAEANAQMRLWAKTTPRREAGEEVEYEVTFLDGVQLRGLITIHRDGRPDLARHLSNMIEAKSGAPLPDWMPLWMRRLVIHTRNSKEKRYGKLKYTYQIGTVQRAS